VFRKTITQGIIFAAAWSLAMIDAPPPHSMVFWSFPVAFHAGLEAKPFWNSGETVRGRCRATSASTASASSRKVLKCQSGLAGLSTARPGPRSIHGRA
jgi:hypothetical protein